MQKTIGPTNQLEVLALFELWNKMASAFIENYGITSSALESYADNPKSIPEGLPPSIIGCIRGVITLETMREQMKHHLGNSISLEDCAWFAYNIFNAGINIGMASAGRGFELTEPLATTRQLQIKNQPTTRNGSTRARDDINEEMEFYCLDKGHPPKTLGSFLTYLSGKGYSVHHDTKKVHQPEGAVTDWGKPRAFGTINNWIRAFNRVY